MRSKVLRKQNKSGLVRIGLCITMVIGGLGSVVFGTSILENIHLQYIRAQSRNVVKITNERGGGGTGSVVRGDSGKYYILTNTHICNSTDTGVLSAYYQGDKYEVKIIKNYQNNDLCVTEAPTTVTGSFSIASSVDLGERVYTVGHPLLEPTAVSEGELSNLVQVNIVVGMNVEPKDCSGPTYELIDLSDNSLASAFGINSVCIRSMYANPSTAAILPGNSGSPTVNIWGSIVGVAFAANEAGVRSYHVPLEDIKDFLKDL